LTAGALLESQDPAKETKVEEVSSRYGFETAA
jgi:hypothetical protein